MFGEYSNKPRSKLRLERRTARLHRRLPNECQPRLRPTATPAPLSTSSALSASSSTWSRFRGGPQSETSSSTSGALSRLSRAGASRSPPRPAPPRRQTSTTTRHDHSAAPTADSRSSAPRLQFLSVVGNGVDRPPAATSARRLRRRMPPGVARQHPGRLTDPAFVAVDNTSGDLPTSAISATTSSPRSILLAPLPPGDSCGQPSFPSSRASRSTLSGDLFVPNEQVTPLSLCPGAATRHSESNAPAGTSPPASPSTAKTTSITTAPSSSKDPFRAKARLTAR